MNLKMMNESFKRKYSNTLTEAIDDSDKEQLRKALVLRSMNVVANGGSIKSLEVALQEVIENFYPDHCWWEVTDCQIFNELLAGTNPREICDSIIDQLKPEFAGIEESLNENASIDREAIWEFIFNVHEGYDGERGQDMIADLVAQKAGLPNGDYLGDFGDHNHHCAAISDEDLYSLYTTIKRDFTNESKSIKKEAVSNPSMETDKRFYVYASEDNCVSDGFITKEDAIEFAEDNSYPIVKIHKYYIDNDKHYPDGDPVVVWNKNKYVSEAYEQGLVESLKECLNRLNEAQMSDEDKHDSALIKGMIDKIEKRSNARFTPEEQAMMDKYGITRNNWNKELSVDGRSLHPDYDGKQRKVYTSYDDWKGHYVQNGDPSKINYADRARKLPKRSADQISGKWTPNGYINAHTRKGQSTLQDVERNTRNAEMQEPVNDMKRHLQDRKWQQEYIDGAQDEYDKSMASAQAEYDRKMKYATDTYRRHTVDATKSRDAAQARIDKMLKRK